MKNMEVVGLLVISHSVVYITSFLHKILRIDEAKSTAPVNSYVTNFSPVSI